MKDLVKNGSCSRAGNSRAGLPEGNRRAVLLLANHDIVLYNFRLELIERLLSDKYEVHISSPYGGRIHDLTALGAVYHEIQMERHGMNPAAELRVLHAYQKLIQEIQPVIVFGYTIKPNIYGAIAARWAHVPFAANITGLGTAAGNGGIRQHLIMILYKAAFAGIQRVFFQNREDEAFFRKKGIALHKHVLLPGSGVNLDRYTVCGLPQCGNGSEGRPVRFAFISRIMKEKGIEQYLDAAEKIKQRYPHTEFHICGFCEAEYEQEGWMHRLIQNGTVIYHGMIRDVAGFMAKMHCIVHPTYYPEGISNVLLEACACGRAVITTNRCGCREAVREGISGYMVQERNAKELADAVERFIGLSYQQKAAMGRAGRRLAEKRFNRQIVVKRYMDEVTAAQKRSAAAVPVTDLK